MPGWHAHSDLEGVELPSDRDEIEEGIPDAGITDTETECRQTISAAWLHYSGPDAPLYYERLTDWYADPVNAKQVAEINRNYIAAMQRDPKLD